ncbi:hypothetical protein [Bacillus sp. AFS040349]|uniref:hypothetical protein n=1 Tax=Bacillus sp. AFS040349 TaxID=2033502 RepID=UPI000BFE9F5F|nr:hypothetical protein [Bacillus sp. AFS040349]PGT89233.1 hypothetical protein COD11_04335 [Bacillus sp. AFS040349]
MKAPIPKHEEDLIHEYIMRTYLLDILESDRQIIKAASFKLHEPYLHLVEEVLKKVRIDLRDMKAEMNKLKIKVTDQKRVNEDFVQYDYFAHGYRGYNRYWDAALKMKGTRLLENYFNGFRT